MPTKLVSTLILILTLVSGINIQFFASQKSSSQQQLALIPPLGGYHQRETAGGGGGEEPWSPHPELLATEQATGTRESSTNPTVNQTYLPNNANPTFNYTQNNNAQTLSNNLQNNPSDPKIQGAINSTRSRTLTVYHDTKSPEYTGYLDIQSDSYGANGNKGTIPDLSLNGDTVVAATNGVTPNMGTTAITKDTTIRTTAYTENRADLQYQYTNLTTGRENSGSFNPYNPAIANQLLTIGSNPTQAQIDAYINANYNNGLGGTNVTTSQIQLAGFDENQNKLCSNSVETTPNQNYTANNCPILTNNYTGKWYDNLSRTTQTLGNAATDESRGAGCITTSNSPIVNRRIGICSDGLYSIRTRSTDTAGNSSPWVEKVVERDSVAPGSPTTSISKNGSLYETMGISIGGEGNTIAHLTVYSGLNKAYENDIYLDANGTYSNSNVLGVLVCGGNSYNFKTYIIDRAGNKSGEVTSPTITTSACPIIINGDSSGYDDANSVASDYGKIAILKQRYTSYIKGFVGSCVNFSVDGIVSDMFSRGYAINVSDTYSLFNNITAKCGFDPSILNSSDRDLVQTAQNVLQPALDKLSYWAYKLYPINAIKQSLNQVLISINNVMPSIIQRVSAMLLPIAVSSVFEAACVFISSPLDVPTLGGAALWCLGLGSAVYAGTIATIEYLQTGNINYGNVAIDFASSFLGGIVLSGVIKFTIKGIKYFWFRGAVKQSTSILEEIRLLRGNPVKTIRSTKVGNKVIWLEEGEVGKSAGWWHIRNEIRPGDTVTRYQQFIDAGLVTDENSFKNIIFDIIDTGVATPGTNGATVYTKSINGKNPRVIVAENGFIITVIPN